MSPRRAKLVKLMAKLDQDIAEAESLASDKRLTRSERRFAAAQMEIRRGFLDRVVAMLGKVDGS